MRDPETRRRYWRAKLRYLLARVAAGIAVCIAGYVGINPPDYVAAVVTFAFGLAASSSFPAILAVATVVALLTPPAHEIEA